MESEHRSPGSQSFVPDVQGIITIGIEALYGGFLSSQNHGPRRSYLSGDEYLEQANPHVLYVVGGENVVRGGV
jgi:hypothetical protein